MARYVDQLIELMEKADSVKIKAYLEELHQHGDKGSDMANFFLSGLESMWKATKRSDSRMKEE